MKKNYYTLFMIILIGSILTACTDVSNNKNITQESVISSQNDKININTDTKTDTNSNTGTNTQQTDTNSNIPTTDVSQTGEPEIIRNAQGCFDSDGGLIESKRGFVVDDSDKRYNDSCMSSTQVREYKCNTIGYAQEVILNCKSTEKCVNGECVSKNQTLICSDTDVGSKPSVKGVVTDKNGIYTDECINTRQLTEYYCSDYTHYSASYEVDCELTETCSDGACVPLNSTNKCSDSDGGRVSMTKGTVTDKNNVYTDKCLNTKTLIEYRCSDTSGFMSQEYIDCKTTEKCLEGACVESVEESSCYDSDLLNEYNGGYVTDPKGTYYDECASANSLIEYKCNIVGYAEKRYVSCSKGCLKGACNT